MPKTSAQGNGIPGGANTEVQFNDNGAFNGDAAFTWDKTGKALTLNDPSTLVLSSSHDPIIDITQPDDSPYAITLQNTTAGGFAGIYMANDGITHWDAGGGLTLSGPISMDGGDCSIFNGDLLESRTFSSAATNVYKTPIFANTVWTAANGSPTLDGVLNIASDISTGVGTNAVVGTLINYESRLHIQGCGNGTNSYAATQFVSSLNIGTGFTQTTGPVGASYLMDMQMVGSVAAQPRQLIGHSILMLNQYNGSPADSLSVGIVLSTLKNPSGAQFDSGHTGDTFPLDIGLHITGFSTASAVDHAGYVTGILVGGTGGPWGEAKSIVGTGLHIRDYQTAGIALDNQNASTAPDISFTGFFEGFEMTAPSAGAANSGRIYFQDNGAGKTQLMVKFNTGAAQQIAIQP